MPKSMWRTLLVGLIITLGLTTQCAALDWAIERNFRYFVYPSDNAVQIVAADIFFAEQGRAASPEDLEHLLNGPSFWTMPLAQAGSHRARWPLFWRDSKFDTVADLIEAMRAQEGRTGLPRAEETSRLGWASVMTHGSDPRRSMGSTDTCWDPAVRLHVNCRRYGDYVRPLGWIVRIYDPTATAQSLCSWSADAGALAAQFPESHFATASGQLAFKNVPWRQDHESCQEIRMYVPSDGTNAKEVTGSIQVVRTDAQGKTDTVTVTPRDNLIVGFGDSFTSGEGNPEQTKVLREGDGYYFDSRVPHRFRNVCRGKSEILSAVTPPTY